MMNDESVTDTATDATAKPVPILKIGIAFVMIAAIAIGITAAVMATNNGTTEKVQRSSEGLTNQEGLVGLRATLAPSTSPTQSIVEIVFQPVSSTDLIASHEPSDINSEVPSDFFSTISPTPTPVTEALVTNAPVTEAPVPDAPVTEAPVTRATTDSPTTFAPTPGATLGATTKAPVRSSTVRVTGVPLPVPTGNGIVPRNPVPKNPDASYFNYDVDDLVYGPEAWSDVDSSDSFLKEFTDDGFGPYIGFFDHNNPLRNRCGQRGRQSPIDLFNNPPGRDNCVANHIMHTRSGTFRLPEEEIVKLIESNKLRLVMPRRVCIDMLSNECRQNGPPLIDYPTYSSDITHFSDLMHLDIKVPGEHTLEGVSFDAEVQLFHIHPTGVRTGNLAILVRARSDGYNAEFQAVLDQFQFKYNVDQAQCAVRRRRREKSVGDDVEWDEQPQPMHDPELLRRLQTRPPRFNPYTAAWMTTLYYFRYDGTTTDPPCYPVTWFVMSSPMVISLEQLAQVKRLIFTYVDGDCRKTSVHSAEQSVARPLQFLGDRKIIQCTDRDFVAKRE